MLSEDEINRLGTAIDNSRHLRTQGTSKRITQLAFEYIEWLTIEHNRVKNIAKALQEQRKRSLCYKVGAPLRKLRAWLK